MVVDIGVVADDASAIAAGWQVERVVGRLRRCVWADGI
jgi:hypothetical protein